MVYSTMRQTFASLSLRIFVYELATAPNATPPPPLFQLEGCNKELDGIERSYLISKGITALLTTTPCTIGM